MKPEDKFQIFNKKFCLIILSMTTFIIILKKMDFTFNVSPSMAEGLYIKKFGVLRSGDIVLVCLSDPYKKEGLERGYLRKGLQCNGEIPLIKKIIAFPGDNVLLKNDYIEVNEIKYFYKTFYKDSHGRDLKVYPRRFYSKTNGYWLIGGHSLNSWDSRYWGPVSRGQIIAKLKPILTW